MTAIGFTGTRRGMSAYQEAELKRLLQSLAWTEFHHGMCLGADEQASFIALNMTIAHERDIIAHPCTLSHAQSTVAFYNHSMPVLPSLERNDHIVEACDILIAAPLGEETQRSGTWYTVRRAREAHKIIYIISRGVPDDSA